MAAASTWLAALAAKVLPFGLFETRRLVGAAVGIIGLFVTWRIGRRLGGPLAGLIALVLLAACPLYYGHMFMNAKDAPFAVAMAILLLGLVRAFEEYPQPGARRCALAGIGLGLAFGSRIHGRRSRALTALVALLCRDGEARAGGLRKAATRLGDSCWRCCRRCVLGYVDHGAGLALVGRRRRSIRCAPLEYFSRFFEKPWRSCSAASRSRCPTCRAAICRAVRAQAAGNLDRARPGRRRWRAGRRRAARICRCRAAPICCSIVLAALLPVGWRCWRTACHV